MYIHGFTHFSHVEQCFHSRPSWRHGEKIKVELELEKSGLCSVKIQWSNLGWADVAFSTVLVEGPDISLTRRAKSKGRMQRLMIYWQSCNALQRIFRWFTYVVVPVALLFGQDNIPGREVSEQSDWRLLPARLSVFIQRMVVIIHLIRNKRKYWLSGLNVT